MSLSFISKQKMLTWHHKCSFSCDRKDVLYVLICNNCDFYYIGQIEKLKKRTWKHKSDVINPITVTKKYSKYWRTCSRMKEPYFSIYPFLMKEPYFSIYPFLYDENKYLQEFKERRYIMNWEPQLSSYR